LRFREEVVALKKWDWLVQLYIVGKTREKGGLKDE
jgi:hypothetical protein